MRSIHQWLSDYGEHHQNRTNKALHWVGIPIIVLSLVGMLYLVPLPCTLSCRGITVAFAVIVLALLYYFSLSRPLAVGMLIVFGAMYAVIVITVAALGDRAFPVMLGVFLLGWVIQFVGHKIEGQKPSFFEDLQFLLVGPLWLLSDVYRRLGISY
jgi:uncharacterized membrane protein YGL010W